jgi:hypothetical protein
MMALQLKATTYLKKVTPIVPKLDHGSRDRITKSLTAIGFFFDHNHLQIDYRGYAGTLENSSVLSDLAHLTSVFGGKIVINQEAISKVNEEIISLIDEVNSSNLDEFLKEYIDEDLNALRICIERFGYFGYYGLEDVSGRLLLHSARMQINDPRRKGRGIQKSASWRSSWS